jgi:hypothetical protein
MSTTTSKSLETQIEELIRGHIAASRRAAAAAVERAFGTVAKAGVPERRSAEPAKRATGRRRAAGELEPLLERLYEAVCANPGALMVTLAAHLGVPSSELNYPATVLRERGRLRSAGRRQGTRYFPMIEKRPAKS